MNTWSNTAGPMGSSARTPLRTASAAAAGPSPPPLRRFRDTDPNVSEKITTSPSVEKIVTAAPKVAEGVGEGEGVMEPVRVLVAEAEVVGGALRLRRAEGEPVEVPQPLASAEEEARAEGEAPAEGTARLAEGEGE